MFGSMDTNPNFYVPQSTIEGLCQGYCVARSNISSHTSKYRDLFLILDTQFITAYREDGDARCGTPPLFQESIAHWALAGPLEKKALPKETKFGLKISGPPAANAKKKDIPSAVEIVFPNAQICTMWQNALRYILRFQTSAVFEIPLSLAFQRAQNDIPAPVKVIGEFLDDYLGADGIFRLSGGQGDVNMLKDLFNTGKIEPVMGFLENLNDINVATNVLKLYLRELPDPLLTYAAFDQLHAASSSPEKLKPVIHGLPVAHFKTTKYLMNLLHRASLRASESKMDAHNLAVVFGPTIMRNPRQQDALMMNAQSEAIINVCETIILNYDTIFPDATSMEAPMSPRLSRRLDTPPPKPVPRKPGGTRPTSLRPCQSTSCLSLSRKDAESSAAFQLPPIATSPTLRKTAASPKLESDSTNDVQDRLKALEDKCAGYEAAIAELRELVKAQAEQIEALSRQKKALPVKKT